MGSRHFKPPKNCTNKYQKSRPPSNNLSYFGRTQKTQLTRSSGTMTPAKFLSNKQVEDFIEDSFVMIDMERSLTRLDCEFVVAGVRKGPPHAGFPYGTPDYLIYYYLQDALIFECNNDEYVPKTPANWERVWVEV